VTTAATWDGWPRVRFRLCALDFVFLDHDKTFPGRPGRASWPGLLASGSISVRRQRHGAGRRPYRAYMPNAGQAVNTASRKKHVAPRVPEPCHRPGAGFPNTSLEAEYYRARGCAPSHTRASRDGPHRVYLRPWSRHDPVSLKSRGRRRRLRAVVQRNAAACAATTRRDAGALGGVVQDLPVAFPRPGRRAR